jgi:hypothetical protein
MRFRRNGNYYTKKTTTRPINFNVDDNGCFVVISHAPYSSGYVMIGSRGGRTAAHRLIYEECFGEIPDGLVVRHKCDVRNCINPEHLELGTQRDNVLDAVKRNRLLQGERHGWSKINENTVRNIKLMVAEGKRNIEIAAELNLHKSTVCNVKRGATWKHVN